MLLFATAGAASDDQVQRLDRGLIDAVEDALGQAVEPGERRQTQDTGEEAEGGAVHRLRDTLREHRRLHRGIDTGDAGERLDETGDGPEQAGEGRQVPQHRQVASPLLQLRKLAERLFVHALLHVVLGSTRAAEASGDDLGDRSGARLTGVDRALDVPRDDLRLQKRHQLVDVNLALRDVHLTIDPDVDGHDEQDDDRPHAPAAFLKVLHQKHFSFSLSWVVWIKVWEAGLPVEGGL